MRVIKLGGSLLNGQHLQLCLNHIAAHMRHTIVVIGGGVFADQVRIAQQDWQIHDVAAHHMAILAMQQMALLVNALQPDWALVQSVDDLQNSAALNKIALWFPDIALLNKNAIPATWRITSDSLAAWLAGITGATELIIVKSTAISFDATLADLIAQGILDDAFLDFIKPVDYTTNIVNWHDFIQNAQQSH